eukprot:Plantae.Rhodophyta-Purpureofilum_apyrenoidigerum.ctg6765.p1 GENE.Plantae.Rhodophyta-Purpureofilum_apyrenoidigerum.ctg6765~~Plantae.Rhodophyta-Purpureofilum_apyrenoidigerum.ctg6765.p1  ORF type:complete len:332 (-),score=33.14 Plantae.Rhodophyta-Purpureofilum_apyrenoidigerum.ctg6765:359-1354(-)
MLWMTAGCATCVAVCVLLLLLGFRSGWLRRIVLASLLASGEVPRNVAIIMDGNRRWARKRHLLPQEGHKRGEQTMIYTLEWCLEAGINTITLYAFSIENFKRPQEEVDSILELAEENMEAMLHPNNIVQRMKCRVRIWGCLDMLPERLQRLASKVMLTTEHYDGPNLNICFAYTARHEIAQALISVRKATSEGLLSVDDIDENMIAQFLDSGYVQGGPVESSFPDVLIRTSGETRLSDFLLWQSAFAYLAFIPVMWPDFSPFDYVSVVLAYRQAKPDIDARKQRYRDFIRSAPVCRLAELRALRERTFREYQLKAYHLGDTPDYALSSSAA